MLHEIKSTSEFIKGKISLTPQIGIILGTGLGGLVKEIEIKHILEYTDIPNFPVSTVEGHQGRLIFGILGGKNVVAMQGRFHFYEGYNMQQIVFPVRVMKFLGIQKDPIPKNLLEQAEKQRQNLKVNQRTREEKLNGDRDLVRQQLKKVE